MADIINGVIGVDDVLQGKRVKDATQGLSERYQDRNPFIAVQLRLTKAKAITNPKFDWFFKDEHPYWGVITAGATVAPASTQTFPVDDVALFAVNDVVYFPDSVVATGESAYGVVIQVGTTDIIIESFESGNLCTKEPNQPIFNYSNSQPGWGAPPTSKVVKDREFYNYPQFLRAPFDIDVWQQGQKIYTDSSESAERVKELHNKIRREMEHVAIWGQRGSRVFSGGKQYFAAGLYQQINTGAPDNIVDLGATPDEDAFDAALMETSCKSGVGSNKRFWFMGLNQFLRLSSIMKGKERITQQQVNIAGITFSKYAAPNGKILYMVVHNAFENSFANDSLVVDASQVRIRNYKQDGVLTLHEGIQNPNYAGLQSEWRSIFSVQLLNPYSCGYMRMQ